MKVLISTYGSRGDVQPMAALALAFQAQGAEARLCAPPDDEFTALARRANIPLVPAFSGVADWIEWVRLSGMKLPQFAAVMVAAQFEILASAAQDCDLIVAAGLMPSMAAARAAADDLGIGYAGVALCPRYLPSPDLPPVEYPGWPHPPGVTANRALWAFNAAAINDLFGGAINDHRVSVGLPKIATIRDHVFTRRPLLAADPTLGPWEPSDLCDGVQTGTFILPDARPLPAELQTFLEAGAPPVYVGFGSMPMQAAPDAARAAIGAIRAQGRRALLARGRAAHAAIDDADDCLVIDDINQQALFQRVAAVIHHGGAGTTTTAARAGAPQVIVPQVADQPYWGARVTELGIGTLHDGPIPTLETLSSGLSRALATDTCAKAVAATIRIDGAAVAAERLTAAVRDSQ